MSVCACTYTHTYIHTYIQYVHIQCYKEYFVSSWRMSVLETGEHGGWRCLGAVGSFVGKVEAWSIESITGANCQVEGQSEGLSFLYVFLSDV